MTSTPPDAGPPRGWYADPAEPGRERYWDGQGWTQVVRLPEVGKGGLQTIYQPAPPPQSDDPAQKLPLAGWWLKLISGLIDYVIVTALTLVVLALTARSFAIHLWQDYWDYSQSWAETLNAGVWSMPVPSQGLTNGAATVTLLAGGVMAVYTIIFLGTWGASLGQRAVGIWVVQAPLPNAMLSSEAKAKFKVVRCGWLRAVSKGLSWSLFSTGGSFFILVQIINVLLPLWHKRRQSLTDLFANTLVIVGKPLPPETPQPGDRSRPDE